MRDESSKSNRKPEMELINKFREILCYHEYVDTNVRSHFGDNKNKHDLADIEFLNKKGEYLVLEAKSHNSGDAYNTFHKVFGELLKERGKNNAERKNYSDVLKLGILIPEDPGTRGKGGIDFYRKHFRNIPSSLFLGFGQLVGAEYIFVCSEEQSRIQIYSWKGFYNGDAPIELIGANQQDRNSLSTPKTPQGT